MIRVATALPLAVRRSSGWAPRTPAILITFSCLNGLVIGVSPCVCRLLTAFCFRWRDRHQRGLSDGSKTHSGRSGDLGGPEGGRDLPHGSFLTRRAGLVAYANRKNRAAALQAMADTGERNDQTTTQARASDSRTSVVRTKRHHR